MPLDSFLAFEGSEDRALSMDLVVDEPSKLSVSLLHQFEHGDYYVRLFKKEDGSTSKGQKIGDSRIFSPFNF